MVKRGFLKVKVGERGRSKTQKELVYCREGRKKDLKVERTARKCEKKYGRWPLRENIAVLLHFSFS